MQKDALNLLFDRDLKKLAEEVLLFGSEERLWWIPSGTSNAAGTLCLHINGNLNHFIGAILGDSGYVRNREQEFSARDYTKKQLVDQTLTTAQDVCAILDRLPSKHLTEAYPIKVFGETMTTEYFLLHLYGHLNYHLGQINYLRRMTAS